MQSGKAGCHETGAAPWVGLNPKPMPDVLIGSTLISEAIIGEQFVCDLQQCKGMCCVEGDSGAPLEPQEPAILEAIYPAIKPFLRSEGIRAIEAQGTQVVDADGDWVSPLVDGAECAYAVFEEDGTAKCGIEKAWKAGAVDWKKPLSCHLYPIRLTKRAAFTVLHYHRWDICSAACKQGRARRVPVYRFVKQALIRKFGEDWYEALEKAVRSTGGDETQL